MSTSDPGTDPGSDSGADPGTNSSNTQSGTGLGTNTSNTPPVTNNVKSRSEVKSTQTIITDFIAKILGFSKGLPKPQIGPGEAKRRNGLGNEDYISYKIPWILYFYPDPKSDPNYVLLDPEKDKIILNNTKKEILKVITLMVFLGILYACWQSGVLFPALHTMWFYFWRYITLTIFFLCFMIVVAIMRGFPFFLKNIKKYAELTINPYKDPKAYKKCHEYTVNFRWFFYGGYTIAFALATIGWTFLFICVLVPLFAIFATLCGLLLGNLNTKFVPFGMAEYEVTELGKQSMQKRIENSTGITTAKEKISSGLSLVGDKTGLTKGLSKLKMSTEAPFLKYKIPEVPKISK